MTDEAAVALGKADRAALVAPAGHGKTWTLARAVVHSPWPQLILTHTHAGVHAILRHLRDASVPPSSYHVDTLAGFATRWAAAYPATSEWEAHAAETDWDDLHPAAARVLARPQLLASVQRSYQGVLVDEYQDCSIDQHNLVLVLADVLPTRVVGDPLQGIYAFGSSPSVDFEADVYPHFPLLDSLTTAWRWSENEALAADLQRLREELLVRKQPDWTSYPAIRVEGGHPAALIGVCKKVADLNGTAVLLRNFAGQAHQTASRLGGRFVSMEELEGRDILKSAAALEAATGPARAAALLDVLERCTTAVVPALGAQRRQYRSGALPRVPRGKAGPAVAALNDLATTDRIAKVASAIETVCGYPSTVIYRPEVPDTLAAAARRAHAAKPEGSLVASVRAVREDERRTGRRLPARVVSRTRLVKGLEFDHAIVCDVDAMDQRNIYVALTRAATSVTVIAP